MALFRKKDSVEVVRRGATDTEVETRKTQKIGSDTVEIRRVTAKPEARQKSGSRKQTKPRTGQAKAKTSPSGNKSKTAAGKSTGNKPGGGKSTEGKSSDSRGGSRSGSRSGSKSSGGRQSSKGRSTAKGNQTGDGRSRSNRSGSNGQSGGGKTSSGPKRLPPVSAPPSTARKQMLVRRLPHQTQIVVLEGPVLVEHYVANKDTQSLVGNVYVGKVRNVLPGMEAAFVDFGEGKNGVLYAGDVNYDDADLDNRRKPRIEKALKNGDEVLVQVVKDAMGHKGARLTNEVSLAGRYLVLAPESEARGISRRLDDDERRRLRAIVANLRPKGFGVIVRTAAAGASEEDLKADIERLMARWEGIQQKIKEGSGTRSVYEEPPIETRVIREHFTADFRRLLVDSPEAKEAVEAYLEDTAPELVSKVKLYEDEIPLFERFHVEDQLRKALDRTVWLPSGGHIVIERTEALTVIDVNTGRFVGKSNLEETVLQNNIESAEEIARQLRLRDIGGIIVVDFIDMEIERNRRTVLQRFREELARDKSRTQISDVSEFGLVEMTRKHVSEGLLETFSEKCPTCEGRGLLLHENLALGEKSEKSGDSNGAKKSRNGQRTNDKNSGTSNQKGK
ncbi:MAG: Rne/Rng family ribonuclease [Acidimicrobiia bacterium]|nr:Rne/Rng family ribonuclease [Acidimicrobiia bacterium]